MTGETLDVAEKLQMPGERARCFGFRFCRFFSGRSHCQYVFVIFNLQLVVFKLCNTFVALEDLIYRVPLGCGPMGRSRRGTSTATPPVCNMELWHPFLGTHETWENTDLRLQKSLPTVPVNDAIEF